MDTGASQPRLRRILATLNTSPSLDKAATSDHFGDCVFCLLL